MEKFTGKHLRQSLFFNNACNFIEKEILPQVFSCEFRQISKYNFLVERLPVTASPVCKTMILRSIFFKKLFTGEGVKTSAFMQSFLLT